MDGNFLEKIEQFKLPIALCFLGIVLITGGVFVSGLNKFKPEDPSTQYPKESLVQAQKTISVDVSGAVNKPGVYQLKEDSRIEQAIAAAGGFTQNANEEYISKSLNLAQKLSDGSKVYVPLSGESGPPGAVAAGVVTGTSTQAKVNINSASQSELEALPGIGPVSASKIISDRPYQQIEDLLNKKVLSKSVFDKIKGQLVTY